jgi:hypothetical protein
MTKRPKRKPTLRLAAIEIRQIQQAVAILEGKHGEEAEEMLRRAAARLTGKKYREFRPPECGHA